MSDRTTSLLLALMRPVEGYWARRTRRYVAKSKRRRERALRRILEQQAKPCCTTRGR